MHGCACLANARRQVKYRPTGILVEDPNQFTDGSSLMVEETIYWLDFRDRGHGEPDRVLVFGKPEELASPCYLIGSPVPGTADLPTHSSFQFSTLRADHQSDDTMTSPRLVEQGVQIDERGRDTPQVVPSDATS